MIERKLDFLLDKDNTDNLIHNLLEFCKKGNEQPVFQCEIIGVKSPTYGMNWRLCYGIDKTDIYASGAGVDKITHILERLAQLIGVAAESYSHSESDILKAICNYLREMCGVTIKYSLYKGISGHNIVFIKESRS